MPRKKIKKYPVTYEKTTIMVPLSEPPRDGLCDGCKRTVKDGIKVTQIHHFKYQYRLPLVKEKPELAMKNTAELCYSCHRIGDALRVMLWNKEENIHKIVDVAQLMPEDMKLKLDILSELWLSARKNKVKQKLSDYV